MQNAAFSRRHLLGFAATLFTPTVLHAARGKARVARPSVRVVMALAQGSLRDRGFHDAANRGLLRASLDLGVQASVVEPGPDGDRVALLKAALADRADLVLCLGFPWSTEARALARKNPTQRFCVVDDLPAPGDSTPDNLLGVSFREDQGSYLVGVLAAALSKAHAVGFVGGMDGPFLQRFVAGFRAGALRQDPKVRVEVAFADTTPRGFTRPARGKELALGLLAGGADVLFHASGATGLGVMEAVVEKQALVVGVDRAFAEAGGRMPAVMTKDLAGAVFGSVKSVVDGTFKGGTRVLDLASGGVALTYDDTASPGVPAAVRAAVEAARADLLSGAVKLSFP